jgi:hypothetical protein
MSYFTITLPAPARALRALRPSFRSITLPQRFVEVPEHSVHVAMSLHSPLCVRRQVPVFVKERRI